MGAFALSRRTVVLESGDTSAIFVPFTDFSPAGGVSKAKALLKLRDVVNNDVEVTPAYQTATTNLDHPNVATPLGAVSLSAQGATCTGLVSISTSDVYWIRFGVLVKNLTTTSLQRAEATLWVSGRDA